MSLSRIATKDNFCADVTEKEAKYESSQIRARTPPIWETARVEGYIPSAADAGGSSKMDMIRDIW